METSSCTRYLQKSFFENVLPTEGGEHIFKTNGKNKEKRCQQASIIKLFEASYGDSKNELQIMIEKRPQIEKVLQTLTGATCFAIFSGGRGPCGGGLTGLMQPKVTQN